MLSALVTGINGQDGSYLAELLLAKGYKVIGSVRPGSDCSRIAHMRGSIDLAEIGLEQDDDALEELVLGSQPDEVYNLAARASSKDLWTCPRLTAAVNALAPSRMLECLLRIKPGARF